MWLARILDDEALAAVSKSSFADVDVETLARVDPPAIPGWFIPSFSSGRWPVIQRGVRCFGHA